MRRFLAFAALVWVAGCRPAPRYDVVIRGGEVLDGTGGRRYTADVAILRGKIVAIGDVDGSGSEEIDATGLFVAPGFINLHSHARLGGLPTAVNMLTQGVTTEIINADGGGPDDLDAQMREAESAGLALNVGPNVGFNSIWAEVMGPTDRRPTEEDIARMHALVEAGLGQGAWGVSAGLDYKPAYFSRTEEVVRALGDLGSWRTVFTNHDRITPESGFSSMVGMTETVDIGEATGLTPVITHMKVQGHEQGSVDQVLAMMDAATERGTYTAADAYPYLAGQTSLAALIIPGWAQEGGRDAMLDRFADPTLRARIVREADEALDARFNGPAGVFLPTTQRELTDVMRDFGVASGGEAIVRILQTEERSPTSILRFGADSDLEAILRYPATSIACDCDAAEDGRVSHPRGFGTFPRVLGHYVRELGILSWEEAIRKMTGLPASTVGMVDRGYLAVGMAADVVVFDPETVIDHSTYTEPTLVSEGIRDVLVNGTVALRDGEATGLRAGEALDRTVHMPTRPTASGMRHLAFSGDILAGSSQSAEVEIDVRQGPDDRTASGVVRVTGSALGEWEGSQLGILQTTEGWASFTATLVDDAGEESTALFIVDRSFPTKPGDWAVFVSVEGVSAAALGDVETVELETGS